MKFQFTQQQEQFRDDVTAFVKREWAPPTSGDAMGESDDRSWTAYQAFRAKLAQRQWLTLAWPKEWGGLGASPIQQAIYNEQMGYFGAPAIDMGADRVGPTLMMFGTEAQKAEFLPDIVSGRSNWCQGFSEPNAGSDLAALQTRAVRQGDEFIVNGQKIWTSNAHHADWMLLLTRTDPDAPKHRGISVLLLDTRTPGVHIEPLVNLAGHHGFNQVFFDDVHVPADRLVGELNRGWYIAATTLDFERSGIGRISPALRTLEKIGEFVRLHPLPRAQRDVVAHRLAQFHVDYQVGRLLAYRVAWLQEHGKVPNYEASMSKSFGSEMQQRLANFLVSLQGVYGQLMAGSPNAEMDGFASGYYLTTLALTIGGGTSEIQRNIIATRGLGLPRG